MWKFETTHGRMDSRIAWQDTRGARKTIRPIGNNVNPIRRTA